MGNAASKSAPRSLADEYPRFEVRIVVVEPTPLRFDDGYNEVLVKEIRSFSNLAEAVDFAQRVWRRFGVSK